MLRLSPFITLIFILFLAACQPNPTNDSTWLVGKIDNPTQEYVIIKHNRNQIDTVKIDDTNFFRYKFKKPVTEEMYSFEHGEYYPFYIDQVYSFLLLANTCDIETSLYFPKYYATENILLLKLNHRLRNDCFFWPELHEYSPEEFTEELAKRE